MLIDITAESQLIELARHGKYFQAEIPTPTQNQLIDITSAAAFQMLTTARNAGWHLEADVVNYLVFLRIVENFNAEAKPAGAILVVNCHTCQQTIQAPVCLNCHTLDNIREVKLTGSLGFLCANCLETMRNDHPRATIEVLSTEIHCLECHGLFTSVSAETESEAP